jgi:diketogulonate reductase-like aldo/keto reductase
MESLHHKTRSFGTHTAVLNNGVEIPVLGLGTGIVPLEGVSKILVDIFKNKAREVRHALHLKQVITEATKFPHLMIDTARVYESSEHIVGSTLKRFDRKKVFIISKLSNRDQQKGKVKEAFERSLNKLKTDYIDLYLLHWPQTGTFIDSWKQMEDLYETRAVRAIGVSNFHIHHLSELQSIARITPAVNEIERHPLLNQQELISYCAKQGIQIIAYSPIGRMNEKIRNNKELLKLAEIHKKTIAQIILRWHYQQHIITIPNTLKVDRLAEYFSIFDFYLTDDEMHRIDSLNKNLRFWHDPDNCDFSKL